VFCRCYWLQARALFLYGFDDLAAQCVMVRVKGQPADAQMLVMVEWGVFFDEVTASDGLVVVTFDGHVVSALQSIYCA
jgi:ribulose-5-phosphate 4-epimerase/fuculose-1-phosphate aldolase